MKGEGKIFFSKKNEGGFFFFFFQKFLFRPKHTFFSNSFELPQPPKAAPHVISIAAVSGSMDRGALDLNEVTSA